MLCGTNLKKFKVPLASIEGHSRVDTTVRQDIKDSILWFLSHEGWFSLSLIGILGKFLGWHLYIGCQGLWFALVKSPQLNYSYAWYHHLIIFAIIYSHPRQSMWLFRKTGKLYWNVVKITTPTTLKSLMVALISVISPERFSEGRWYNYSGSARSL